ncbi:hypothetical protein AUK22_09675 [bacterium CG2_30_54_10]|nr:MAG: hypothetical protein AUK22_09675 [bacterium CG2_30_54_10]
MYNKFSFTNRKDGDVVHIALSGYLEQIGGGKLKEFVEARLQEGALKFVVNFQAIELISSPGVAALLDIASKIIDDFAGKIAVFGLDGHHLAVLEMSGLFFLASQAASEPDAIASVNE